MCCMYLFIVFTCHFILLNNSCAVLSGTRKYCFEGHGCEGKKVMENVTSETDCCDAGGATWGSTYQGVCEPCGNGICRHFFIDRIIYSA